MSSNELANERIDRLEAALAHQDQAIEDLNGSLMRQSNDMADLRRLVERIEAQIASLSAHPALAADDEPPPPHY